MKSDGKTLPELSIPSIQLFDKDGHHEIKITAQSIYRFKQVVRKLSYQYLYNLTSQNYLVLMLPYHWDYSFWTVKGSPYKLYWDLSQILGLGNKRLDL